MPLTVAARTDRTGGEAVRRDLSDEGSRVDISVPAAHAAGFLPGSRSAGDLAAHFVRAGWSSRSSSWEAYEVETPWARLEIEPLDDGLLVHGGTHLDPDRFDALVTVLSARRGPFSVEFSGEDGGLLREVADGAAPPQGAVAPSEAAVTPPRAEPEPPPRADAPVRAAGRPRQGLRQRVTDLFTHKG